MAIFGTRASFLTNKNVAIGAWYAPSVANLYFIKWEEEEVFFQNIDHR